MDALRDFPVPVIGFAARSGTGKTTLLKQLVPLFVEKGLRVGVIKHSHHGFDIDHPGKDSFELRKAGAEQLLIASSKRMALMTELHEPKEQSVHDLIKVVDTDNLDLILVEGFRDQAFPKIELHRDPLENPLLSESDDNIIAIASDSPDKITSTLPLLDINDPHALLSFIEQWIKQLA